MRRTITRVTLTKIGYVLGTQLYELEMYYTYIKMKQSGETYGPFTSSNL